MIKSLDMPHILLIEDYPPHAKLMSMDLVEAGYRVETSSTGAEALRAIAAEPPHLILLDRRLPDTDGVEVCRQLRQSGYTRPILLVTAMAGDDHRRVGLAAGADDYLVKPFSPRRLLAAIAHHWHLSDPSDSPSAA